MPVWVMTGLTNVLVNVFGEHRDVRSVLGVYSSKEKAVNAMADFLAEGYFDIDIEEFSLNETF